MTKQQDSAGIVKEDLEQLLEKRILNLKDTEVINIHSVGVVCSVCKRKSAFLVTGADNNPSAGEVKEMLMEILERLTVPLCDKCLEKMEA